MKRWPFWRVAEGIESPRARSMLLDLGRSLAQGHELGRAVPAEVLTDALGDGRAVGEALGRVAA